MPNGNAIFFGANQHTAIYNPTTNQWSAGPNMPTRPYNSTITGASTSPAGSITGASNTSGAPITITTTSTAGMNEGDLVTISGVTGNTAANGAWRAYNITPNSYQLYYDAFGDASQGNGDYTGGGNWFDSITITTPSTVGLNDGQLVTIGGVKGNTAANGTWAITNLTGNTFQLIGPEGTRAYTGGGTWSTGQLTMADAPGAMMPNGDILLALSPSGGLYLGGGYSFPAPTYISMSSTRTTTASPTSPRAGASPMTPPFCLRCSTCPPGRC
jgi:hypothetical protein